MPRVSIVVLLFMLSAVDRSIPTRLVSIAANAGDNIQSFVDPTQTTAAEIVENPIWPTDFRGIILNSDISVV